ncbi:hypothetical protein U9M48_001785 [Paspalum notatum var. saurae]|uniref:Uncharacterized protein n=1 Tax=Paspalum notatum var. saurae TaxID=547442 RepID=A0AAQ3SD47_PASNO
MGRKDGKEKNEEPWTGRRVLGVAAAAAGAVAVAAGAFFLLSAIGDSSSSDQQEQVKAYDDPPVPPRRTMKAPGSGGESIFRDRFEEDPKNYFRTQRLKGPKAAVDRFQ